MCARQNPHLRPIGPSLGLRVRHAAQQATPVIVWLAAIGALTVLFRDYVPRPQAVGVVERRDALVTTLVDGTIEEIAAEVFDPVLAGDVVVLLSNTKLEAETQSARIELNRLRAELEAARLAAQHSRLNDVRRFEVDAESARLDVLDRVTQLETDRVELARLAIEMDRQRSLFQDGAGSADLYDAARLAHQALKRRIGESEKALSAARLAGAAAEERLATRRTCDTEGPAIAGTRALRDGIDAAQARVVALGEMANRLVLRAPMDGIVSRVDYRVGQNVAAGAEIATITDPRPRHVEVWVEASSIPELREGMPVTLISRRPAPVQTQAQVLRVGEKIETFPLRLRPDPRRPQWGICLLVGYIPPDVFYPGEVLDVRFPRVLRNDSNGVGVN